MFARGGDGRDEPTVGGRSTLTSGVPPAAPTMPTPTAIKRTYFTLLLGNTLAASLIWGINTIFLLDAGLNNLEAFAANAFFTAGMVVFEVPTGIVADLWGRRVSFLLGTVTLAVTTALYVLLWQVEAPFWSWAVVSLLLGLGFTFFSGAVEAWLVDALSATQFTGPLESVLARGAGPFVGVAGSPGGVSPEGGCGPAGGGKRLAGMGRPPCPGGPARSRCR